MTMMQNEELTKEHCLTLIDRWKPNPKLFLKDVLGVEQTWDLQDQLLEACPRAIAEKKHIYVGSGHSLGKDYICAGIGLWFLHCYSPSVVINTAPTDRQVKAIMWKETLVHWHNRKTDLGGEAFKEPKIEMGDGWFLLGFATKDSGASAKAGGGKFQGIRSPNMCVIVTEAQAIEDSIFDQIDGAATTDNVLVIYIGNPTRASGRFAKGLRNNKDNIVFNFSCLDNPNYKERRTVIPGLCSYEWVEDKRKKWGIEDPRWQGRVEGKIPKKGLSTIFTEDLIENALKVTTAYGKENAGVALDVSGEGDDENVLVGGKGGLCSYMDVWGLSSPSEEAIKCQSVAEDLEGCFIIIDCDGMGIKTWQETKKVAGIEKRFHLIKFHGSIRFKKCPKENPDNYENLRSKAYFTALDRLKTGRAQLPNDPEIIEEAQEVKWFENKRGLVQIEPKDDIKERLGRSPDRLDAWVMLQYGFSLELKQKFIDEKYSRTPRATRTARPMRV